MGGAAYHHARGVANRAEQQDQIKKTKIELAQYDRAFQQMMDKIGYDSTGQWRGDMDAVNRRGGTTPEEAELSRLLQLSRYAKEELDKLQMSQQ